MLINVLETNPREAADLFSLNLVAFILLLGVIPSLYIWKVEIRYEAFRRAALKRAALMGTCLAATFGLLAVQSEAFASFFREHKILRHYANPWYSIYSVGELADEIWFEEETAVRPIGLDAHKGNHPHGRKLIIFVIGESARSDHFSLNGYERQTHPLLSEKPVFSLRNFYSTGTSTAIAVPRMFTNFDRQEASLKTVEHTENILDILLRAGV